MILTAFVASIVSRLVYDALDRMSCILYKFLSPALLLKKHSGKAQVIAKSLLFDMKTRLYRKIITPMRMIVKDKSNQPVKKTILLKTFLYLFDHF